MKTHRIARVNEIVREVAAETILFELRDPRVKGVTVTRAEVSGDLQHAKVYVSIMGTDKEQELCMHGLRHAAGFVQSKLGNRLQTRYTPVVQFVEDKGVKQSIEVSRLIHEALTPATPPTTAEDAAAETRGEAGNADGTAQEETRDS
ncbi:MAG: 30S ribosome-binding factor RbfA [Planctomycetia bacterium]|nr:30S ribosome-binding factor RbfA [Planctomycetia bacterium]